LERGKVSGVSCYVDNCQHWASGNTCEAGRIEVDCKSKSGTTSAYMEVGEIGKTKKDAGSSEDTMCQTFKPKDGGMGKSKDTGDFKGKETGTGARYNKF
jgi:hypothetical protein